MLFSGDHYYPAGGANDFVKSFDSVQDAEIYFSSIKGDWIPGTSSHYEWFHILDTETGKIVADNDKQ